MTAYYLLKMKTMIDSEEEEIVEGKLFWGKIYRHFYIVFVLEKLTKLTVKSQYRDV